MGWSIVKRLGIGVLQLLFAVLLVFVLIAASPGDPASRIAGDAATVEQIAALRTKLGLDRPLLVQYVEWIRHAGRGDLGKSVISDERISSLLSRTISPTLSILIGSLVITLIVGVVGGSLAALRPGKIVDRLVVATTGFAVAIPGFFLGLVLVNYFAVRRNWFPAVGYVGITSSPGQWFHHLVLPAVALSTVTVAEVTF